MSWGVVSVDWRRTVALALLVVAGCLAVGLVPHAVGGFGGNAVVTNPGPPPSVNADLGDARQRYQNRVTNQVTDFVPLLVPAFAALAAFAVGRARVGPERATGVAVLSDGIGGFAGAAVGYALFVGVATLAYGEVPGGYLLETYPPTLSLGVLAVNAVALGATSALGAGVAGVLARSGATDDEADATGR